jgi:SNF2 family DNA or RNA helicase
MESLRKQWSAKIIQAYVSHLERRSVLDKVLSDCQGVISSIENELKSVQLKSGAHVKYLNQELSLLPHQVIGLNWLIMMNKLKLNAILADEMVKI